MPRTHSPLYQRIYDLVRQIPAGKVSSYGRIARHVGTTARAVGFAMAALPPGSDVPWQRVVNSRGMISSRHDGDGDTLQRDLLELEGVRFDRSNRIDFETYLWDRPD
jgi:methylated-DNA-protein-cysteine methyltransferase-like protein